MSIFDLYDDKLLSGDKSERRLREDVLDWENFNKDAAGEEIFEAIGTRKAKVFWISYLVCLLILGILIAQLLKLQIAQGSFNRNLAEGNRIRSREIAAPRGLILDSRDQILAQNKASFNLQIYPLDLPKKKNEREDIFKKLSEVGQIPQAEIEEKVYNKGLLTYDPVVLKENIDRDTALILEMKTVNLPGVAIVKKPIREYLKIDGLGPLIGFVGKMTDQDLKENPTYEPFYDIGKEGVEASYEKFLKGAPGILEVEVDSKGRQQRQLSSSEPSPGNNLFLSLDGQLEKVMAQTLEQEIRNVNSPGGAAIAINPKSGQILGMVSIPTYDNNLFSPNFTSENYQNLLDDPSKPMFNRAIAGTYPSGSIIKPFVASAGLQEGVITANTTINAPGEIKIGNYVYPDWKVHGLTDVRKAIAESVNVFFYAVAGGWDKIKGLGIAKMDEYLIDFGFGSETGVDLPGEAAGLVPNPEWKEKNKKEMWYLGDTYHLGIGQGDFLVTPLQMATAFSAIANGGELLKPQLVAKITDKDDKVIQDFSKEVIRKDFISAENIQIVREGMRQAVTSGSAKALSDLPEMVAAKTGTAQFGDEGKTHAWMEAFAPYNDPQIAIVVLIEQGGEGYATAGPVVKNILNWYFQR